MSSGSGSQAAGGGGCGNPPERLIPKARCRRVPHHHTCTQPLRAALRPAIPTSSPAEASNAEVLELAMYQHKAIAETPSVDSCHCHTSDKLEPAMEPARRAVMTPG